MNQSTSQAKAFAAQTMPARPGKRFSLEFAADSFRPAENLASLVTCSDLPEYTETQFKFDLQRAGSELGALAESARRSLKDGTARKFPA